MDQKGLSLVELLVVVAIIAVLAGVLFPVFRHARKSANLSTCLSNLRQCGNALLLYEAEYQAFPVGEGAALALAKAPTCDPEDSWRASCDAPASRPRIGSYGYVRLCPEFEDEKNWAEAIASPKPPSLLISIEYGARRVQPFEGMSPDAPRCLHGLKCAMPDRIPSFEFDGSAKRQKVGSTIIVNDVPFLGFTWPSAFSYKEAWQSQTPEPLRAPTGPLNRNMNDSRLPCSANPQTRDPASRLAERTRRGSS